MSVSVASTCTVLLQFFGGQEKKERKRKSGSVALVTSCDCVINHGLFKDRDKSIGETKGRRKSEQGREKKKGSLRPPVETKVTVTEQILSLPRGSALLDAGVSLAELLPG